MTDMQSRFSGPGDEGADIDRRLAEALDLYADDSSPPGLAAMSARAGRMDRIRKSAAGAAAVAVIFMAGWVAEDLGEWRAEPVPREVADLMETERDWEADLQQAGFGELSNGAFAPVSLTDLGLVLTRTETRRARSGAVQRMEYVTRQGRPVSIVLRREPPREPSELRLAAYEGQDLVHWTNGAYAFGVIGDASRDELLDIAETVRDRLTQGRSETMRPVAGAQLPLTAPTMESQPSDTAPVAISVPQAVRGDTPG